MNKSIRSLVVVVMMRLLVCCVVTYKHAQIPDSRLAEGEACFKACDAASPDDGDIECVARCPGAETGDGPCTTDDKVVGGSAQQLAFCVEDSEGRLTSGGKALIAGAIIVPIVVLAALLVHGLSNYRAD